MTEERPERALTRTDVVKKLLLPPAGLYWLGFGGLALAAGGFTAAGAAVVGVALGGLYLLALPGVGSWALERLDRFPALDPATLDASAEPGATAPDVPTAIIVLDAGRRRGAREYGGDGVRTLTLERLAYAAWLRRRTDLPIGVTGDGAGPLMADFLRDVFGLPVTWIEPTGHNTHENAVATARLLRRDGFKRVVLVTHYWHLPRAFAAFAATGLEIIPAPIGHSRRRDAWERGVFTFVPGVEALERSHLAIHEGVGLLWYRFHYEHGRGGPRR